VNRAIILFSMISFAILMLSSCSKTGTQPHQPPPRIYPYWLKSYNSGANYCRFNSVRKTRDGGFIVAGNENYQQGDTNNYNKEASIIKIDAGGNIQWQYGFGKDQGTFLFAQQTGDGGYLAIGHSNSASMLIKLNSNGSLKWQRAFPDLKFETFTESIDGDVLLTGYLNVFGEVLAVIAKMGPDGKSRWQKIYGKGDGRDIRPLADGGFIVLATDIKINRSESYVYKLDSNGAVLWEKHYEGVLAALDLTTDGGVLLAGTVSVAPTKVFGMLSYSGDRIVPIGPQESNVQGLVLKLDRAGNEKWQKLYGRAFEDGFTRLKKSSDGNFIVLGDTRNYGSGDNDLWLLKISEAGSIIWQVAIGGDQHEEATDVEPLDDGGYLVAAMSFSLGRGLAGPILLKVDTNGIVPECALDFFHPTNSIAKDDKDRKIEALSPEFPTTGRDIEISAMNTDIVPDVLSLVAASFHPAEPKLQVLRRNIEMTTYSRNPRTTKYSTELVLKNVGAKDLVIDNIVVNEDYSSNNRFKTLMNYIQNVIFRNGAKFESELSVKNIQTDNFSKYRLTVTVPKSIKRTAKVSITSNDPDNPVITVPVNIISK